MTKEEAMTFAQTYLSDIISFFGVNVTVEARLEEDILELSIPSSEVSSILIGRNAETLRSIQYLLSTVLRNKNSEVWRVNLDIADYKKLRAEKLAAEARVWIEEVRRTGSSHVAHLNPADRRIVHQVATEYSDIHTFSEGEGRDRTITIAQVSS